MVLSHREFFKCSVSCQIIRYKMYIYICNIVVGGSIRNFQQLPFEAFHDGVLLDRCWPFLVDEESIVAEGVARWDFSTT